MDQQRNVIHQLEEQSPKTPVREERIEEKSLSYRRTRCRTSARQEPIRRIRQECAVKRPEWNGEVVRRTSKENKTKTNAMSTIPSGNCLYDDDSHVLYSEEDLLHRTGKSQRLQASDKGIATLLLREVVQRGSPDDTKVCFSSKTKMRITRRLVK